jgi:hypothetical protein
VFEGVGAFRLRLEGVFVFGGYGVDAEVPDAEVDVTVGEDLHESVLAEAEGFAGGNFHPVAAGKQLGGGFDNVRLGAAAADEADFEAIDDSSADTDVGVEDNVAAVGCASGRGVGSEAAGTVSIDGDGSAAGGRRVCVADAHINDGVVDVELGVGGLAFDLVDHVGAGERVDGTADDAVGGVAVEVALGLGEGYELGGAVIGVEREDAVILGEAEIGGHLGSERGAICLFLEEFGIDGRRLTGLVICACGSAGLIAAGGVEVDEGERDLLFGSGTFGADVADDVAYDAVAHDDLVAAVFEDEPGAMRSGCGVYGERFLLRGGLTGKPCKRQSCKD